ncbi:MAG: hypothetical protein U0Q11_13910 [Vicinamibacterales bacterium]
MPRECPNLVEADAGPLPALDGCGDGRMPQAVAPDVRPDPLPEFAHDPQD